MKSEHPGKIYRLCWDLVNELREVDGLLAGEWPLEFSKVFDLVNDIEISLLEVRDEESNTASH